MRNLSQNIFLFTKSKRSLKKSIKFKIPSRNFCISNNLFLEEERKRSRKLPHDSESKKNLFFKKINQFYEKNSLVNCSISEFQNLLQDSEHPNLIPDFAMGYLIEKTLHDKSFSQTIDFLVRAFLHREILDILLYETVLQHFISNNYRPGIPLIISLYRSQFRVPTMNWLVMVQIAFEKNIIYEKQYTQTIRDYIPNNVESDEEIDEIKKMIQSKSQRVSKKLLQFSSGLDRGYLFQNTGERYQINEDLPNSKRGKEILILNPELDKNINTSFENPEIIEDGLISPYRNNWRELSNDNKKEGVSDEDDLKEGISLGYIEMYMKGTGMKNDPLRLNFNYVDSNAENDEFSSSEEESEGSSNEDESEE